MNFSYEDYVERYWGADDSDDSDDSDDVSGGNRSDDRSDVTGY